MALINCPECNKEVSDSATQCPHCGFGVFGYIERQKRINKIQIEAEKEAYLYVKEMKRAEAEQKEIKEKRYDSIYTSAIIKFNSNSSADILEAKDLFESIIFWKDSKKYYNKCESLIEEIIQERKKKERKEKRIIFLITLIVLFAVILLYIFQR